MGPIQRVIRTVNSHHAVLDLGTNTFHLMIASSDGNGGWKAIRNLKRTVKLGRGAIHENRIAPEAFERGLAAIKGFHEILKRYPDAVVHALATSAIRSATNGNEFIAAVRKSTGITITPISGVKEASLILDGVRQTIPEGMDRFLVMDIGGGSVEFILAEPRRVLWKRSFNIGVARLLESFPLSDPLSSKESKSLQVHLLTTLQPLWGALSMFPTDVLVGSSGSFETFSAMIASRKGVEDPVRSSPFVPLPLPSFKSLQAALEMSTVHERRSMPGLVRMRVEMIVPAALLTGLVVRKIGVRKLFASTHALKEGAMWRISRKGKV